MNNITERESGPTSHLVLHTREFGESTTEVKQMTTVQTVGAISTEAAEWLAIDWPSVYRNVRRLQVRIVKAVKEHRGNKLKALKRLLTHSYTAKVPAVQRGTEHHGKKTP